MIYENYENEKSRREKRKQGPDFIYIFRAFFSLFIYCICISLFSCLGLIFFLFFQPQQWKKQSILASTLYSKVLKFIHNNNNNKIYVKIILYENTDFVRILDAELDNRLGPEQAGRWTVQRARVCPLIMSAGWDGTITVLGWVIRTGFLKCVSFFFFFFLLVQIISIPFGLQ